MVKTFKLKTSIDGRDSERTLHSYREDNDAEYCDAYARSFKDYRKELEDHLVHDFMLGKTYSREFTSIKLLDGDGAVVYSIIIE